MDERYMPWQGILTKLGEVIMQTLMVQKPWLCAQAQRKKDGGNLAFWVCIHWSRADYLIEYSWPSPYIPILVQRPSFPWHSGSGHDSCQEWTKVGYAPGAGGTVPRSPVLSPESSCRHWSRSSRSTRSTSHSRGRAPTCKSKTIIAAKLVLPHKDLLWARMVLDRGIQIQGDKALPTRIS